MTVNIRPAVPDDLPQVHEMIGLLARHHGDEVLISIQDLHRHIFDQVIGHILVAAEEDGLVGYALILAWPNLATGRARFEIDHLFVMEWRRRAGIGRALIAAARVAALARGAEVLRIGTHPKNLGAQTAYRQMGLAELPMPGPRFRVELA
ncbi:MAG: GNAT family N-acetyltransferase [Alphaproteobacteria bacterium]